MHTITVIFAGLQGSGKGTQVKLLREYLESKGEEEVFLFEAGAELRAFSSTEGYTQELVRASLARGELQPDFITVTVSGKTFIERMRENQHVMVDGFPRSELQARILDSIFQFYKRAQPSVINLTAPEEVVVERLLKRGRNDDTEVSIRERLRWHFATVEPVIASYRDNPSYRYLEIDAGGTPEEIHEQIKQSLGV